MVSFKTFFLLLLSCSSAVQSVSAPLLVIVLMVKNEADVLEATLQPFVDAGLDSFLIFDTGSTDATIARTQNYFTQHTISSGYVEQEPFIDFATSRNRALELAKDKFPDAIFFLMPDAEWYMHNVQKLIEFCREEQNKSEPSYLVRIGNTAFEFYTPRLIRCASHAHFVGEVHEILKPVSCQKVPNETYFELRTSSAGKEKSAQRWLRDAKILQRKYEENPMDTRNLFYLAQTYGCLGDWENACKYYYERTLLTGWAEEDYVAHYKLANAIEYAFNTQEADHWLRALHYFLKAYTMRPQRIEPLVKIAQHYLDENNVHLAFCFARQACSQSYPYDDILFVEKELYDYTRYDILGRCAWYVGEYEVGEEAVRHALRARPDMPHLHKNLAFYTERRERLQAENKSAPEHSLLERWKAECRLLYHKFMKYYCLACD